MQSFLRLLYSVIIILICSDNTLPRGTVIGSAWKEATQRVYLKGSETVGAQKPTPYISPEPTPTPKPLALPPKPTYQSPQHQEHIIEPSPEEMRMFLAQLQDLLDSDDDEEDDDENDEQMTILFSPPRR